jgi:hypothetical protein
MVGHLVLHCNASSEQVINKKFRHSCLAGDVQIREQRSASSCRELMLSTSSSYCLGELAATMGRSTTAIMNKDRMKERPVGRSESRPGNQGIRGRDKQQRPAATPGRHLEERLPP